MNQKSSVAFATFCHKGDIHRLHAPGQFRKQLESNRYPFDQICIVYQETTPTEEQLNEIDGWHNIDTYALYVYDVEEDLRYYGIDVDKPQYTSSTDQAHRWQGHVVNHIIAIHHVHTDYVVFADNDCWMVSQPLNESWVEWGIRLLEQSPKAFIISPNDGEPERATTRFSQQMFLARADEFRKADFNQPGWDGNVNVAGGPFPEYWALLEGRMEIYCRTTGQKRYVLGPEFRFWHHNRLNDKGLFETDTSKY